MLSIGYSDHTAPVWWLCHAHLDTHTYFQGEQVAEVAHGRMYCLMQKAKRDCANGAQLELNPSDVMERCLHVTRDAADHAHRAVGAARRRVGIISLHEQQHVTDGPQHSDGLYR